jgi:adenylylsulfate kinase
VTNITRHDRQQLLGQKGITLWLTGRPAAGKSTIAAILERMLIERGMLTYRLDGDTLRAGLNKNLGFSAEDRSENVRRIGEVAKLFADCGIVTIVSAISPYQSDRAAVRASHATGDFVEIYVKASLAIAEKRDPKGLYRRARAGEIKGFTGIDAPYEEPVSAELVIDTESMTPGRAAADILRYLETHQTPPETE